MKKHITKDGATLFVDDTLVAPYLKLGWSIGFASNQRLKKLSGMHIADLKWMTDSIHNKRIHKAEVDDYLKLGWKLGRTGYGEKMAAKKWLNLDGKDRRVDPEDPEELENHPIPPWAKGRSFRYVFTDEAKKKISDGQKARYARERRLKNEV